MFILCRQLPKIFLSRIHLKLECRFKTQSCWTWGNVVSEVIELFEKGKVILIGNYRFTDNIRLKFFFLTQIKIEVRICSFFFHAIQEILERTSIKTTMQLIMPLLIRLNPNFELLIFLLKKIKLIEERDKAYYYKERRH